MRLEKASQKAINYSCRYFHYSKRTPISQCAYSVFNKKKEWCGTIIYGTGNTPHIAKMYELGQGEVVELVRVALNGKQEVTSKAISISLKLLKKDCPLVKLVVSFADTRQGHLGIIYQATNWYYQYDSIGTPTLIFNKKEYHSRTYNNHIRNKSNLGKEMKLALLKKKAYMIKPEPKHKYIYPLREEYREMCKKLSKPYPKNNHAKLV